MYADSSSYFCPFFFLVQMRAAHQRAEGLFFSPANSKSLTTPQIEQMFLSFSLKFRSLAFSTLAGLGESSSSSTTTSEPPRKPQRFRSRFRSRPRPRCRSSSRSAPLPSYNILITTTSPSLLLELLYKLSFAEHSSHARCYPIHQGAIRRRPPPA